MIEDSRLDQAYAALADGQPAKAAELAAHSLKSNQAMNQKPGIFASLSLLAGNGDGNPDLDARRILAS